jgi:hypothetical protein
MRRGLYQNAITDPSRKKPDKKDSCDERGLLQAGKLKTQNLWERGLPAKNDDA